MRTTQLLKSPFFLNQSKFIPILQTLSTDTFFTFSYSIPQSTSHPLVPTQSLPTKLRIHQISIPLRRIQEKIRLPWRRQKRLLGDNERGMKIPQNHLNFNKFLDFSHTFYLEMFRALSKTVPTIRNAVGMRFFGSQVCAVEQV